MSTINTVVKVAVENKADFLAYIAKLDKVCDKLDLSDVDCTKLYSITEESVKQVGRRKVLIVKCFEVYEVSVVNPIIAGYTFKARLEFERGKQNPMIYAVPGQELPESFYTATPKCDHCAVKRYRGKVYVLQNDATGEYVQIGASCVKDFLGHGNIKEALDMIARFGKLSGFEICEGGTKPWNTPVEKNEMLEDMIKLVDVFGYQSRKMVEDGHAHDTTAGLYSYAYWSLLNAPKEPSAKQIKIMNTVATEASDEQKAKAALILEELAVLEITNSYEANLKNLATADYWLMKDAGLVASMIGYLYTKHNGRKERAVKKESEYVGEVGKRVTMALTVKNTTATQSMFGTSVLHACEDGEGNAVTFFTQHRMANAGETVEFVGTVKEHKEFRGTKQTVLNRVKFK